MIIDQQNESQINNSLLSLAVFPKIKNEYIQIEEYDEIIDFYDHCTLSKKFVQQSSDSSSSPFLLTLEFLYNSFSPIECDKFMNITDLTREEILQIVENRIHKFSQTDDINYKKLFVDNFITYSDNIGYDNTITYLIPVFNLIISECDEIKIKFLSILPQIVDYYKAKGIEGYYIIKSYLLDSLMQIFLNNLNSHIMTSLCTENLLQISQCLNQEDRGTCILSKILSLANDTSTSDCDSNEISKENKIRAVKLINDLAWDFGQDYCEVYILPQIQSIVDDPSEKVREEIVKILPTICEIISHSTMLLKVQNVYQILSNDLNWKVRKACVEILPQMMRLNKEKSHFCGKNTFYMELYKNFTLDHQKSVRVTALHKIGEFINQLDREEISQIYFDFYKTSIEVYAFNKKEFGLDYDPLWYNKILYSCAYNFPAMLYYYGPQSWEYLKPMYFTLCYDKDQKVKKSIITSIHEVMAILGPSLSESELLPIYDLFLKTKNEEIHSLALSNIDNVLRNISKEKKKKYIKYITPLSLLENDSMEINPNITPNTLRQDRNVYFHSWKNKIELLDALIRYFDLYSYDVIYCKILPLCILLCLDDFSVVRKHSAKATSQILLYLYEKTTDKRITTISNVLKTFAYSMHFQVRIVFIKICKLLLINQNIYQELLRNMLTYLSRDKIIDVRVSMSKICTDILKKKKGERNYLVLDPQFLHICASLANDLHYSVNERFKKISFFTSARESEERKDNTNNNISFPQEGSLYTFSNDMKYFSTEFLIKIPKTFAMKESGSSSEDKKDKDKYLSISDENVIVDEEKYIHRYDFI